MLRTALYLMLAGTGGVLPHKQAVPIGCVRSEPDTVQLAGRLERHTFFGAPNYGETPRTDARETGFYLALASPICSTGGSDPARNDSRTGVRRVQLVLDAAGYARLRPFLGRQIALRGTMFASFMGHHHAPLLLMVLTPVRVSVSP